MAKTEFTVGGMPATLSPAPKRSKPEKSELESVDRSEVAALKIAAMKMLADPESMKRYASQELMVGWQIDNLLGNEPWRVGDDVALAAKCRERAEKVGVKIMELLGSSEEESSKGGVAGTDSPEAQVARAQKIAEELIRPPIPKDNWDGDEDGED